MFDVGFSELALIFGVSLVVLGPKKLPGLVRKVGRWVGKARSMARDFQQQLENEVNLEELNRMAEKTVNEALGNTPPAPDPATDPYLPQPPAYPYSAQESSTAEGAAQTPAADALPAPESAVTDDTYSHAHAAGDAPMADVASCAAADSPPAQAPVQADLDLAPAEDDSHLPPDDARRYS